MIEPAAKSLLFHKGDFIIIRSETKRIPTSIKGLHRISWLAKEKDPEDFRPDRWIRHIQRSSALLFCESITIFGHSVYFLLTVFEYLNVISHCPISKYNLEINLQIYKILEINLQINLQNTKYNLILSLLDILLRPFVHLIRFCLSLRKQRVLVLSFLSYLQPDTFFWCCKQISAIDLACFEGLFEVFEVSQICQQQGHVVANTSGFLVTTDSQFAWQQENVADLALNCCIILFYF